MLEFSFRPIRQWPRQPTPAGKRKAATFRAGYVATLDLLERELSHLKARDIVFEADCDSSDIRNDGRLRSSAKLRGPGIVLSFESSQGPMRFPCDRFLEWGDNLRAIALTLEHLRAVDRYGVTQHAEQYKGWTALEDKRTVQMNPYEAAVWMASKARDVLGDSQVVADHILRIQDVFHPIRKKLAVALHPDRRGSDVEFKQLELCREVIERGFA